MAKLKNRPASERGEVTPQAAQTAFARLHGVAPALIAHSNIAERAQEIQFFKNMGLTGGFLYVAAFGAGAWSLDAWRLRRRDAVAAE
jgi:uncharacterized membrane protein YphA (DoxX/SURF4 family)